jgi:type IV pilus assembly protein PilQ
MERMLSAKLTRIAFASLALCALSLPAAADMPQGMNQIVDLEVGAQGDGSTVTVRSTSGPSYSVYQLQAPPRLFVDFSNTELAAEVTNWTVRDGLIDEVFMLQYQDDASLVTRVVIALENEDAEYDVEADGTDITIVLEGERRGVAPQVAAVDPTTTEAYQSLARERDGAQAELSGQRAQLARMNDEMESARSALAERNAALQEATAREAELQDRVAALEAEGARASELEAAVAARDAQVATLAAVQAEYDALEADTLRLQRTVDDLEATAAQSAALAEERRERVGELEAALEETSERESARQRETELLAERLAALEAELDAARQAEREALARAEAERRDMHARLEQAETEARQASDAARVAQAEAAQRAEAAEVEPAAARDLSRPRPVPEPATEVAGEPARITDVTFEQTGGADRLAITFDRSDVVVESLPWEGERAGLIVRNAVLPESLQRTLDTRAFGGAVQYVSSFNTDGGDVRIVADLAHASSEILTNEGGQATWEFTLLGDNGEELNADFGFDGYNAQEEAATPPPLSDRQGISYMVGQTNSGPPTPRLSRRYRVTIDVVNADIQNVLRLFSDQGDVNIIASDDVQGRITLRLRGVPLDQAFGLILQSQGLGLEQRGNIIRVAPLEVFEEERARRLAQIAEEFELEPIEIRVRAVSYADGDEIVDRITNLLSRRGGIEYDERTRSVIIRDVPGNLDAAEQVIDLLDTQTPQVLIEARIVQTGETFSRGFGIQWGGDALFAASNGNATGLLFPSTIGIAGGAGQAPADGTSSTPNYAVNIPGPGTGAIGFTFGSLGQAVNLNLRLSAAEQIGEAKVVSSPRILTLHGQSASISSGVSIPVQSTGAAGTNVTFVQANLSLNVTPTVTPDGFVILDLNITKNEPDFARTGANGDPSIVTNSATTQLLVRDGETSVIGGIFTHVSGSDETRVPILADIPILGALFHDYQFQDERNETMVFITPRIVNRELALHNYSDVPQIRYPE